MKAKIIFGIFDRSFEKLIGTKMDPSPEVPHVLSFGTFGNTRIK